jgi:hypothetical protein
VDVVRLSFHRTYYLRLRVIFFFFFFFESVSMFFPCIPPAMRAGEPDEVANIAGEIAGENPGDIPLLLLLFELSIGLVRLLAGRLLLPGACGVRTIWRIGSVGVKGKGNMRGERALQGEGFKRWEKGDTDWSMASAEEWERGSEETPPRAGWRKVRAIMLGEGWRVGRREGGGRGNGDPRLFVFKEEEKSGIDDMKGGSGWEGLEVDRGKGDGEGA